MPKTAEDGIRITGEIMSMISLIILYINFRILWCVDEPNFSKIITKIENAKTETKTIIGINKLVSTLSVSILKKNATFSITENTVVILVFD